MLGWLGALKDFPEKQDPGMCLLRGNPPPKKQNNKKKKNKKRKQTNKQKKTPMQLSDFLKNKGEKKVKTLNQRERHSRPSLWPVGTTPPTLQKKQGRLKKNKKKKPVDERLQGEAHFSESFAPSMEPHSGLGLISHF